MEPSIAEIIERGFTYLGNAYTSLDTAGAAIPQNKNILNLAAAIDSIPKSSNIASIIDRSIQTITSTDLSNVYVIGDYAFKSCELLAEVTLPDTVWKIGTEAFADCISLYSVSIPANVSVIESLAFKNCTSLATIIFNGTSAQWDLVTKEADWDYNTGNYTIYCLGDETPGLLFILNQNNTYDIGGYNGSSTTVKIMPIHDNIRVTGIADHAFYNHSELTNIDIPMGITSVGYETFYGCSSISSLNIPSSITRVDNFAFYGCSNLTNVNYLGDIDSWCSINFGTMGSPLLYAQRLYFNNTIPSGDIILSSSISKIPEYTFKSSFITSITIPGEITEIGDQAFADCQNLTSVTLNANSVVSIGTCAFYSCINLSAITLPRYTTNIGVQSFSGCTNLTSISIPRSVVSINNYALASCSSLEKIIFDWTIAGWGKISKSENWDYDTGEYVIYCTDGNIPKN